MHNYTKYSEAKKFFIQLSEEGIWIGTTLLNDYEDLKKNRGELAAARYLLNVYLEFQNYNKQAAQ